MLWVLGTFWPILIFITGGIFVFITEEPLWKKLGLILLVLLIYILKFSFVNIYVVIISHLAMIVLLIILLIYFRNRGLY